MPIQSKRPGGSLRKGIVVIAVFGLVQNLLMLTGPLYMLQVHDRVSTSQKPDTLTALSLAGAVTLTLLYLHFAMLFPSAALAEVADRALAPIDQLAGQCGSGKTTLGKVLAGIRHPQPGA